MAVTVVAEKSDKGRGGEGKVCVEGDGIEEVNGIKAKAAVREYASQVFGFTKPGITSQNYVEGVWVDLAGTKLSPEDFRKPDTAKRFQACWPVAELQ